MEGYLRGNRLTQVHVEKWPLKRNVCMWDAYLIVLLFRGMFSTVLTFVICMINYFIHPLIIVLLHSSFACDRQTDLIQPPGSSNLWPD